MQEFALTTTTLIIKRRYDWFNDAEKNPYLPYLYDGISNGEQGQIASTRMYLETPNAKWADSQVRLYNTHANTTLMPMQHLRQ